MALKPKIKDGVKFYNITSKNKEEANRLFEKILDKIYKDELAAKRKVEGLDAKLSTQEVSRLRKHPDLGVWVIDGKPATVTGLNGFLVTKKKKTLSLHIPKERTGYTRKYLESPKNMNREVKKWFDRLDKQGWPKGTSRKGFTNFLTRSYDQTAEYNKILEKQLGFKFDAGHFWGAMGPEGNRTIIGPYGFRSEGKFTFRNVTSQPRTPSMKQLLNPKWNVITPNVPGFFDKAGVQIASAEDLLNVGGGGQGWHGALADYLTQGLNDIDKMSAWEKAYIAFGDPSKGASGTPEVRLAELLEPGGRDKVLQRVGEFTETAEDLSGPVRKIIPGSEESWQLHRRGVGSSLKPGQSIFHMDMGAFTPSGGGTAALVRSTAFDVDLWKEALKGADPSLHPIGAGIGFAVDYALDPEYQKRIHNIVTGQAEQGDVPYVATKTAVNTVTGAISEYAARKTGLSAFIGAKAGSIFSVGLPLALGGSEDEKIRWSRLGYESKEAYDAAMKKHEEKEGSYEKPKPFINSLFNRN